MNISTSIYIVQIDQYYKMSLCYLLLSGVVKKFCGEKLDMIYLHKLSTDKI